MLARAHWLEHMSRAALMATRGRLDRTARRNLLHAAENDFVGTATPNAEKLQHANGRSLESFSSEA
jgi:hypothetical protein